MKYLKFKTVILSLVILLPVRTFAFDLPKDLPTIEALIALHKAIKKDEDKALQRVATSFGEQSVITKGANKFNDVRTTLDTRLNNAHSYLVLAGAISSNTRTLQAARSNTCQASPLWHGTMRMRMSPYQGR